MIYSNSGRSFQFWEYRVGHGSLLIRSPKGAEAATNIDLIFVGVEFLMLPRYLEDITASVGDADDVQTVMGMYGAPLQDHDKVYVITSKQQRYYIVGVGFKVEENDLERTQSPFDLW